MRSFARCLTLALVFAAIVVVQSASPAHACSCVAIDTQIQQRETFPFDAAFVGRVSGAPGVVATGAARLVTWTFLVDEVYRGELPPIVEVQGPRAGDECGFGPIADGSQLGVLLRRDGDNWISGGCSSGPPERFALLGPPKKPTVEPVVSVALEPDDGGLPTGTLVAVGGPLVVLVAIGTALVVRRRGQPAQE